MEVRPMKLRKDYKSERQKEAKERQEAYDKLTATQKLAKLDAKYGKGQGATKERARIEAKSKTPEPKPVTIDNPEQPEQPKKKNPYRKQKRS